MKVRCSTSRINIKAVFSDLTKKMGMPREIRTQEEEECNAHTHTHTHTHTHNTHTHTHSHSHSNTELFFTLPHRHSRTAASSSQDWARAAEHWRFHSVSGSFETSRGQVSMHLLVCVCVCVCCVRVCVLCVCVCCVLCVVCVCVLCVCDCPIVYSSEENWKKALTSGPPSTDR